MKPFLTLLFLLPAAALAHDPLTLAPGIGNGDLHPAHGALVLDAPRTTLAWAIDDAGPLVPATQVLEAGTGNSGASIGNSAGVLRETLKPSPTLSVKSAPAMYPGLDP